MTLRGMIPGANALKPTGRLWVLVRRQNEHETTTLPDRNTLALGQALELCDEMGRYAPGYSFFSFLQTHCLASMEAMQSKGCCVHPDS